MFGVIGGTGLDKIEGLVVEKYETIGRQIVKQLLKFIVLTSSRSQQLLFFSERNHLQYVTFENT